MDGQNGWARFGAALGGNSTDAFNAGALRGVTMEQALLKAREERDKEVGRQAAAKQAADAGDTQLANLFLQGGVNPGNLSDYQQGQQKMKWGGAAWDNATGPSPDLELLNRMNAVREGKVQDLTRITDHTAFNPMLMPGSQQMQTDEIGRALIGTEKAQQGAYGASANASNAAAENSRSMAALHGATMRGEVPERDAGGHARMSAGELGLMFAGPDGEPDPARFRAFKAFEAKSGLSETEALKQWAISHEVDEPEAKPEVVESKDEPGILSRLFGGTTKTGPVDPATQKRGTDAVTVSSQEDFDKLAPGTLFINPADGRLLRKK